MSGKVWGKIGKDGGGLGKGGGKRWEKGRLLLALRTFGEVQEMGEGRPGYSATEGFGEGWK